ncbi:BnaC03g16680D [Brassica napus]|uniref:Uncharacterized protein n=2 Tax=Brassica TaxID=3705 RepID=A0A3P6AWL6_BRAOL|nr:unnamed protein product [Brassica napus]CDY24023.1 BnaC03g16680D [Brassica napus]VDC88478.1 unnamed protein product [Brassica oleracea]
MTSSKLYFVALLIILSALVSSVQYPFVRIMDASSDCDFRGPCKKKEDCYDRCGVNKPPFNNALCAPLQEVNTLNRVIFTNLCVTLRSIQLYLVIKQRDVP